MSELISIIYHLICMFLPFLVLFAAIFFSTSIYHPLFTLLVNTTKTFYFLCFMLDSVTMAWGVTCWVTQLLQLNFTRLILMTSIYLWYPGGDIWSTDLFALESRRMRQLCIAYKIVATTYIMRGKNWHLPKYERPSKGKNVYLINQLD